jgi:hypothetical protein
VFKDLNARLVTLRRGVQLPERVVRQRAGAGQWTQTVTGAEVVPVRMSFTRNLFGPG